MARRDDIEIIELINDPQPSWGGSAIGNQPAEPHGDRSPEPHSHLDNATATPRRRVLAVVAGALGIAVLVTAAMIGGRNGNPSSVAPGRSSTSVAANTTATTNVAFPITSTPEQPLSEAERQGSQYLASAPEGFATQWAYTAPSSAGQRYGRYSELWATSGANATTGHWFLITVLDPQAVLPPLPDGYQQQIGTYRANIAFDPYTQRHDVWFTTAQAAIHVQAFDWDTETLMHLVSGMQVGPDQVTFDDPFFEIDHSLVHRGQSPTEVTFGQIISSAGYFNATTGQTINVRVTAPTDSLTRNLLSPFVIAGPTQLIDFGHGKHVTAGTLASSPDISVANWTEGDWMITAFGDVEFTDFVKFAFSVRPATDQAWESATQAAVAPPSIAERQSMDSQLIPETNTMWWVVKDTYGYIWNLADPMAGDVLTPEVIANGELAGQSTIHTIVSNGITYVLASVPRTAAESTLKVRRTNGPSIDVPLVDVDPGFSRLFAVYGFSSQQSLTAELVDSSGAIIAAWPTTRTP